VVLRLFVIDMALGLLGWWRRKQKAQAVD